MNAVPNDELLHNAVLAFVGVQRRLLVTLEASGEDVARVAAVMTAELDQLEAALRAHHGYRRTLRPGYPGQ